MLQHLSSCRLIQSGELESRRHEHYKRGGKLRRDLDAQCYTTGAFTEEQHDQVMNCLRQEFGKTTGDLDYLLRVLNEEILLRVYSDFMSMELNAAEIRLANLKKMPQELIDYANSIEDM